MLHTWRHEWHVHLHQWDAAISFWQDVWLRWSITMLRYNVVQATEYCVCLWVYKISNVFQNISKMETKTSRPEPLPPNDKAWFYFNYFIFLKSHLMKTTFRNFESLIFVAVVKYIFTTATKINLTKRLSTGSFICEFLWILGNDFLLCSPRFWIQSFLFGVANSQTMDPSQLWYSIHSWRGEKIDPYHSQRHFWESECNKLRWNLCSVHWFNFFFLITVMQLKHHLDIIYLRRYLLSWDNSSSKRVSNLNFYLLR